MTFTETSTTELYELEANLLASIVKLTKLKVDAEEMLNADDLHPTLMPINNSLKQTLESSLTRLEASLARARFELKDVLLEIIARTN